MRSLIVWLLFLILLPRFAEAQHAQKIVDSINKIVVKNGFNRLNSSQMKEGYWIEIIQRSGEGHNVTVDLRSGFFSKGKKVGIWKSFELGVLLNRTEYYLDSQEQKKIVCIYFPNGNVESEGFYLFDKNALDSLLTKDRQGTPIFVPSKGKFVRDGFWRENWENGQIKEFGTYRRGEKKGRWLFFDNKGNLISSRGF